MPNCQTRVARFQDFLIRTFVVITVFRFIVPAFVATSFLVSQALLAPDIKKHRVELEQHADGLSELGTQISAARDEVINEQKNQNEILADDEIEVSAPEEVAKPVATSSPGHAAAREEVQTLSEHKLRLEGELASLQADMDKLTDRISEKEESLLTGLVEDFKRKFADTPNEALAEANARVEQTEAEVSQLELELACIEGRTMGLPELIAEQVDGRHFEFSVERALFAMVANRCCAPSSKRYCHEQWLAEDVRIERCESLELHHLYRAMDFLEAHKEAIEEGLYFRIADLLNLDVELMFYDTTSLHFEVDEDDVGVGEDERVRGSQAAGAKTYRALRKRGKSKNGRGDVPQVVVGLAVTREGFPVRHWVFPGNTVDVTTVAKVKEELKGWRLNRCVFVGDAGMVSPDNLHALARGGGRYIVCMPVHRGGEVDTEVVSRPGRYREVAQNLQVKEVVVGEGERRRRYVVCFNPREGERQSRHRAEVLAELEAELATLRAGSGVGHGKRACELRASGRYGKYLRVTCAGRLAIDRAKVKAAERLDGKFVVHSNDDTLSAEDLALGYKQLQRVEQAWRQLKSALRLRPVHHRAPHRIHAHIALTVIALLLERIAEHECADSRPRPRCAPTDSPGTTDWRPFPREPIRGGIRTLAGKLKVGTLRASES